MNLAEYIAAHQIEVIPGVLDSFPRIKCKDGFSISIQAGRGLYCTPRDNQGPWREMEAGFPSDRPSDALMEFAAESEKPTETVYGYVPVEVLQAELDLHGGIDA